MTLLERFYKAFGMLEIPQLPANYKPLLDEVETAMKKPEIMFLHTVAEKGLIHPEKLWNSIHNMIDPRTLIKGELAHLLAVCPMEILPWVIGIYEEAVTETLYHFEGKRASNKDLPRCPNTGLTMLPDRVDVRTMTALETVWNTYYGTPWDDGKMPSHMPQMYADLLRITWHMERVGQRGFTSFEQKWEEVKNWPKDRGIVGPYIISSFLTPPGYSASFYEITDYMAPEEQLRLYMEALSYYTSTIDRNYFADPLTTPSKVGPLARLAKEVIKGGGEWDDDVLEKFYPYYKSQGESDGKQVDKAGDP